MLTSRSQWLAPALVGLCLIVALVYWPGLSGGFVFDDFPNLVDNDRTALTDLSTGQLLQGAFASDSGPLKRPLVMLGLSIERYLFGLDPFPMKATNLLIHLINTLLIFLLLRNLLARHVVRTGHTFLIPAPHLALLIAGAWALAPINLTAVLFVIQRMESLATLFILLGLLGYWRGRVRLAEGHRGALRWMWGGLVIGGGLGLLAKESAVMLPVYAGLIEWLLFGFGRPRSAERRAVLRLFTVFLVIPALLGLSWLLPRILANPQFPNRPFDLHERLWTEARVLWHYLTWIVVPNPGALSLYHDTFAISRGPLTPWTTLPAALGLAALGLGAFLIRKRWVLVSLGIFWFFIMHLLVSTVLNLELVYEHRNYLGSMGILLALFSLLLTRWPGSQLATATRTAVIGLVLLYAMLTGLRAQEWSDPIQQAYFEATRHPDSPRATYALGKVLTTTGEPGSPQYTMAIEQLREAAALPDAGLLPLHKLVFEAGKHGYPVEPAWWEGMERYVANRPITSQDRNALYALLNGLIEGTIHIDQDELGRLLKTAWESHPRRTELAILYANYLLNVAGDYEHGGSLLQWAVARKPTKAAYWKNLIQYQIAMRQWPQAEASLNRLKALDRLGLLAEDIHGLTQQMEVRRRPANLTSDPVFPRSPAAEDRGDAAVSAPASVDPPDRMGLAS